MSQSSEVTLNGVTLRYAVYGQGPPVALTSGGRSAMEDFRPLAEHLASSTQVLIYDRRNCGTSDVALDESLSEFEIWADDLHALMGHLQMSPAYVGGHSAGCTVSMHLAQHYPQDVKGILLVGPGTGDPTIIRAVADKWYGQCVELAQRRGMAAIIKDSYFGQHLELNPTNRARLLSMNVPAFCAVMTKWQKYFAEGCHTPITGITEAELSKISVPTIIVPGFDDAHPQAAAETLDRLLPQSELVSLAEVFSPDEIREIGQKEGSSTFFQRIARVLLDFISKIEATP